MKNDMKQEPPPEQVAAALAVVDGAQLKQTAPLRWLESMETMCRYCERWEDVSDAAARVLAAEVRRLRALAPETQPNPPRGKTLVEVFADEGGCGHEARVRNEMESATDQAENEYHQQHDAEPNTRSGIAFTHARKGEP